MRKWTNSKPACQCDMFLLSDCSLTDMALYLRILLILAALTGIHSITTVSEVSVKAGGSISIPCLYGSQYINHVKYLCKGYLWNHCSYAFRTDQQSSGKYSISDDKNRRIFTVTINYLTSEDTHYWCAVEINGGSDKRAYFHLSVTRGTPSLYVDRQEITGFIGEQITIKCHNSNSGEIKWCKLGGSCVTSSGSIDGTRATIDKRNRNVFTVTMSGLRVENSGWYYCAKGDFQMPVHVTVTQKPTTTTIATTTTTTTTQTTTRLTTISPTSEPLNLMTGFASPTVQHKLQSTPTDLKNIIIPLSLLIVTVMVALFIWFILKKQKQTRETSAATAEAPNTERDVDVVYSVVRVRPKNNAQRAQANDENVIYSTVAFNS
ncbi:uncharacterized protein LOC104930980 isoform X5 [Larimichthys crocea]|uniref:uncharacterized protein LOC104930980 isoform X5 n=1 Tax=Larimichthys crocea TaxID=215358 RepID=UPI000F5F8F73|nr:uncharacterized protein LOC104930980 isoform X5 [Larimichthys crocea]